MKDLLLNAQVTYLRGQINKHLANVSVLLQSPTGIGQHQDIQETIEKELGKVAEYDGKLNMIAKYLIQQQPQDEGTSNDKDSTVTKK
jgi:hypothetical protein|tara:strand:+ start:1565 stop:1825 length:261 start_codon:yes stop_codon:yes gene_type:complete